MTVQRWIGALAVCGLVVGATSAFAQPQPPRPDEWKRGTTLAGFAGVLAERSAVQPAAGAALGWEIAPHLSVEGQGTWLRPGDGAGAFAAQLRARVPLRRNQPVVPFAAAGVGLYRATFDGGAAIEHEFYRRRAGARAPALGVSFDDFMAVVGGGVDVFLARRLALRPEVAAVMVTDSGHSRVVPLATLQVVYHFDTHEVIAQRRR